MRSIWRPCRSGSRSSAAATSRSSSPASSPRWAREVDLVYRQPLPLRGFDQDLREGLAEALKANGIALHPGCQPHRIERARRRRGGITLANGQMLDDRPRVLRHRPHAAHRGARPGARRASRPTRCGAVIVDAQLRTSRAAYLRDRRRHRPAQPDAGGDRRGARAGRPLFGRDRAAHLARQRADRGVLDAAASRPCGLTEEQAAARGPVDIYVARFTPMRHALSGRNRRTHDEAGGGSGDPAVLGAHMLGEDAPEIMQGLGDRVTAAPPRRISTARSASIRQRPRSS